MPRFEKERNSEEGTIKETDLRCNGLVSVGLEDG